MPLFWSEIRSRTVQFVCEWRDERNERAESQSFWNEFFAIFGLTRRRIASFEVALAECYDPIAMLCDLHDAHRDLSRAVERAYGVRRLFTSDHERMEFLLECYATLVGRQEAIPLASPRARRRRA